MPKASDILSALVAACKTIHPDNQYLTTIDPANVYSRLDAISQMQQVSSQSYPRLFIISEGAQYDDLPSHRLVKAEQFSVFALFANDSADLQAPTLEAQVADFIEDFERMVDRHKQIGGSDFMRITTCVTDVGSAEPEAVCLFEVVVQYKQNFN